MKNIEFVKTKDGWARNYFIQDKVCTGGEFGRNCIKSINLMRLAECEKCILWKFTGTIKMGDIGVKIDLDHVLVLAEEICYE